MRVVALLITLFISFSCKKDKLEDENNTFIGKWTWVYSSHSYGWCDGDDFSETLNPETEGNQLSIEFHKKGIVRYFENDKVIGRDRIVFSEYTGSVCDYLDDSFYFAINLNNNSEVNAGLNGCINNDSIIVTHGFPYEIIESGCESYVSYFIRE